MTTPPRARPLGPPAEPSAAAGVPPGLRPLLEWADGFEIERNVAPATGVVGVNRVRPAAEVEPQEDGGVVFADGVHGTRYALMPDGGVDVLWPEALKAQDPGGRRRVAAGVAELLGSLMVTSSDTSFDGQPHITELDVATAAAPPPVPAAIEGDEGPDASSLEGRPAAYLALLPDWLRSVLERRNGGYVVGVPVASGVEDDELAELYCVAPRPQPGLVEALSLRDALLPQGLPPDVFPFARTQTNVLLLAEAGSGRVLRLERDSMPERRAMSPVPDGDELVATLRRLVGLD